MNDFPELLTPDEVAKIFRVSYHKALDIIKYHMKHIKIGIIHNLKEMMSVFILVGYMK